MRFGFLGAAYALLKGLSLGGGQVGASAAVTPPVIAPSVDLTGYSLVITRAGSPASAPFSALVS